MSVWNLFAPFSDQNESCQSGKQSLFGIRTHHFSLEINPFWDQNASCQPRNQSLYGLEHIMPAWNCFLGLELIISVWKAIPFWDQNSSFQFGNQCLFWDQNASCQSRNLSLFGLEHIMPVWNCFLGLELIISVWKAIPFWDQNCVNMRNHRHDRKSHLCEYQHQAS